MKTVQEQNGTMVTGEVAVIMALARGEPIDIAAGEGHVNVVTVRKWVKDEAFLEEVRKNREDILFSVAGKLSAAAGVAVQTLEQVLNSKENASIRVRAALGVLANLLQYRQYTDGRPSNTIKPRKNGRASRTLEGTGAGETAKASRVAKGDPGRN